MKIIEKITELFNRKSFPSPDPIGELNITIQKGNTKKALKLIKELDNPDRLCLLSKQTPLKCAIKERNLAVLNALLDAGASPNLSVDMKPLERALIRQFFDGATVLLERGADFKDHTHSTKDNMFSKALLITTSAMDSKRLYKEEKCLKLLQTFVDKGANVNEVNTYGKTPITIVADSKRNETFLIKLADILLKRGAVVTDDAIEFAHSREHKKLAEYLEKKTPLPAKVKSLKI